MKKRDDVKGQHIGHLTVLERSEKRGVRGKRTVPLWKCRCDCGAINYKATDTITGSKTNMCEDCAEKHRVERMHENAGFVDGTQVSKFTKKANDKPANAASGVRGVYYEKKTHKWRARIKFKGKLISLGTYDTIEQATEARKLAEKELLEPYINEEQPPTND